MLGLGLGLLSSRRVLAAPAANLMDGRSWVQYQCDIAFQGNDVKFIKNASAAPRGAKNLTGLSIGATYRCIGNVKRGTIPDGNGIWFRVTTDQPMTANKLLELTATSGSIAVDHTFVATATAVFIGPVGVAAANGQYVVIDNDFRVEYVSG